MYKNKWNLPKLFDAAVLVVDNSRFSGPLCLTLIDLLGRVAGTCGKTKMAIKTVRQAEQNRKRNWRKSYSIHRNISER